MKYLQLTKGKKTLVDDDIYERFKNRSLFCDAYGYAGFREDGKLHKLHRTIINAPKHLLVDHINFDSLDNRRENLRLATRAQNQYHRQRRINSHSQYKGIRRHHSRKWYAKIGPKLIGIFETERQAAMAYDLWAHMLHGEFAVVNFPNAIHT
jgi:hypothetical protein